MSYQRALVGVLVVIVGVLSLSCSEDKNQANVVPDFGKRDVKVADLGEKADDGPSVDVSFKADSCQKQCTAGLCGPDGCGGQCGCSDRYACCAGKCVAPPAKCTCTCVCKLQANPSCAKTVATSSAAKLTCDDVCDTACSMGCGGKVSATGNCPPTASCP